MTNEEFQKAILTVRAALRQGVIVTDRPSFGAVHTIQISSDQDPNVSIKPQPREVFLCESDIARINELNRGIHGVHTFRKFREVIE